MSVSGSVFGLGLRVNVPLAGLRHLPPPRRVDVNVCMGSLPPELDRAAEAASREIFVDAGTDENGRPGRKVSRLCDGRYFRIAYADATTIVVDAQGDRVWATWPDSATAEDTATYLLGPVLAFVLRLRGYTCLHASAVAVGARAIAVAGPSGAGKSSTAAGFARLGCPVLSDDIVALEEREGRFHALPALPRVYLWPESAASLFGPARPLPRVTASWDKRLLDLSAQGFAFQRDALPLAAIYLLGERREGGETRVEPVHPRDALMTLISDTHATEYVGAAQRAREFDVVARLVREVALRRVKPCADLGRVAQLCAAILRDLDHV